MFKILENANQSIVALGDQCFPENLGFRLTQEIGETFGYDKHVECLDCDARLMDVYIYQNCVCTL